MTDELKVIPEIHKKFGQGSVFRLGETQQEAIPVIPTGSLQLDLVLGVGGLPRGRIVELYGPNGSGKSSLCQHVCAEIQKLGGRAAFVDVENALDTSWAETCGLNVNDLYVSQPDTGEQALDIVEAFVRSGDFDVVVLDSIAALAPMAEINGQMGDSHVALVARLMAQALRKLSSAVKKTNTLLIFTNQLRMRIGIMFGNPATTTGGEAMRYFASVRLETYQGQQIKDTKNDLVLGNEIKITVKKNKVAPPFKVVKTEIRFDEGISKISDLIELGQQIGVIEKSGAWYTFKDEKVQGTENLRELVKQNKDLENEVRQMFGLPMIG